MKFKIFITESLTKEKWEHALEVNPMLRAAHKVLGIINSHGYAAKIVGGAVRDLILGNTPKDVDVSTNAPIEKLDKWFKSFDIGKNRDFGIIVAVVDGFPIEIAQFREESGYSNNRHPDSVNFVKDFKSDAARRDFRFNSMGIDHAGRIHDFHGGQEDIKNRTLRTVGDPHERFSEDALRLLRAIRFSARMDFKIHQNTLQAIRKNSHTIKNVSPERIKDELWKMASQPGPKFADAILKMNKSGLLEKILPEIKALQGFLETPRYHPETMKRSGTVFDHTIEAIKMNKDSNPLINIGILFHDVGKGKTFKISDDKRAATYHSHDFHSGKIVDKIAKRLKFTNDETDAIKFAVENHMKFHHLGEMKPSKIVNLMKHKHFDILKAVSKCDDSCRLSLWDPKRWKDIIDKIEDVQSKWGDTLSGKSTKVVDGNHVMSLTGLKPGKELGDIIKEVTEWILDNNIKDQNEIDKKIMEIYNAK